MKRMITLHFGKRSEGVYLATCEDLPGRVAQGRTIRETLEIARDVGEKLLDPGALRADLLNSGPRRESRHASTA